MGNWEVVMTFRLPTWASIMAVQVLDHVTGAGKMVLISHVGGAANMVGEADQSSQLVSSPTICRRRQDG